MQLFPQFAAPQPWLASVAALLTPRRLRAHATLLAVCLWGICIIDFSTPGQFDRAGNIKFQDFLPTYISARLIAEGRSSELYNQQVIANELKRVIPQGQPHQPTHLTLPNLYGPQFGLLFVPLSRFSFSMAARIWVATSLLLYFACIYLIWKSCPTLLPHRGLVSIAALAFPPLFHFFVRGQNSVLVLAFFTAAFLAFRADRNWLAGIALGFLIFKPQFIVAIPLVLLLAHSWRAFAGLVLSAAAQLALTRIYFGPAVMRSYFDMLVHIQRLIDAAELSHAPIQMHSLRSFWSLLVPAPEAALALYVLSSIVIVAIAAAAWRSSAPLALRFSALTLAAVLVNPHLFVYDLLVLAPALLLILDWTLTFPQHRSTPALRLLAYLAFLLPLFGPLSHWTHLQLSVLVFTALLWALWRDFATPSHKLASNESAVV
ncbi:MAG TPA: glycosyltransferase family 87 protein [Candidatus Sulfotelmatobacter sp.]|jgi:hypothetical protein